jgi:hypothetical protein
MWFVGRASSTRHSSTIPMIPSPAWPAASCMRPMKSQQRLASCCLILAAPNCQCVDALFEFAMAASWPSRSRVAYAAAPHQPTGTTQVAEARASPARAEIWFSMAIWSDRHLKHYYSWMHLYAVCLNLCPKGSERYMLAQNIARTEVCEPFSPEITPHVAPGGLLSLNVV